MFTQPQTVLLFLFLAAPVYWLIPPSAVQIRRFWLIFISLGLIAFESVLAAAACIGITIWVAVSEVALVWVRTHHGSSKLLKRLAFWGSLTILVLPLFWLDLKKEPIAVLGLSYVIMKSSSVLIDAASSGKRAGLGTILLLNSFFPIFSSGPIEDRNTFSDTVMQANPNLSNIGFGISRMLEGFILSFYVGQNILLNVLAAYTENGVINPEINGISVLGIILLKFLYLYINFTGYTSFAIGLAAFFGIRIRENFRYPFLARTPEEFWNRWHISLGQFLSKYLYFRMVVSLKRPYIALFLAFVIVGLWHSVGIQYLLWGVGHGGFLIIFLLLKRRFAKRFTSLPLALKIGIGVIGWAITMIWVSFLSFMANAPDMDTVFQTLFRIF